MNPPLILNGVTISAQNLGSRIGVFLTGHKQDIEWRFFAFWNYGATCGELEWWSETCALFWLWDDKNKTASEKIIHIFTQCALSEILSRENTKGTNPMERAEAIAIVQFETMHWVNWYKQPGVFGLGNAFSLGSSIKAERDTGNFNDDVVGKTLERHNSMVTAPQEETETCV